MLLAKQKKRLFSLALCAFLLALSPLVSACAQAPDPAMTGMAQFRAKQYKLAALSFRKAIIKKPRESTLYVYYALSLQYSGDIETARGTCNQIIQYFTGTEDAKRAWAILKSIEATAAPMSAPTSAPTSTPTSTPRPTSGTAPRASRAAVPDGGHALSAAVQSPVRMNAISALSGYKIH